MKLQIYFHLLVGPFSTSLPDRFLSKIKYLYIIMVTSESHVIYLVTRPLSSTSERVRRTTLFYKLVYLLGASPFATSRRIDFRLQRVIADAWKRQLFEHHIYDRGGGNTNQRS